MDDLILKAAICQDDHWVDWSALLKVEQSSDSTPPLMPLTPQSAVDMTHHFLSTHWCLPTSLSSQHFLVSTMMTMTGLASQQAARILDPNLADSSSTLQSVWLTATTFHPALSLVLSSLGASPSRL
jgi:hypothetical protein